ncbi:MAG TPA: hypothetical protein VHO69_18740 [Phototrophicaceae bacterium]|nr:hypothetical protein [Phototrophicaceae bacterium]
MLNITPRLIQFVTQHPRAWELHHTYATLIAQYGGLADALGLLPHLLKVDELTQECLLLPIAAHGDTAVAQWLVEHCLAGVSPKPGITSEVLWALGFLGYEPAEALLIEHLTQDKTADYYSLQAVCLGLLHFSCAAYQDVIRREVEACYGQNLFKEFVPALAYKTGAPDLLDGIYELGRTTASTDCNGGIFLGIALYGARDLFKSVLWDEYWEAGGYGTGTDRWAFVGTQILGLTLAELYQETFQHNVDYRLDIFHRLLAARLHWPLSPLHFVSPPNETCADLWLLLNRWSNPNQTQPDFLLRAEGELRDKLAQDLAALRSSLERETLAELLSLTDTPNST